MNECVCGHEEDNHNWDDRTGSTNCLACDCGLYVAEHEAEYTNGEYVT